MKSLFFKIHKIVAISTLFIIIQANTIEINAKTSNIYNDLIAIEAESYILIDCNTKTILAEKNMHTKYYPASITKIMTALLLLENRPNLSENLIIPEEAVYSIERNSSHIGMEPDEIISYEDALNGILLMSANDVSAAVAIDIGTSLQNFSDMMNNRAAELGALNTHFKNPHGLPDEKHVTTAYDMAQISIKAFENPHFREVISSIQYMVNETNKKEERELWNSHKMIYSNSSFYYPHAIGGKTGYTSAANHTLVTYAVKDDIALCCIVLNDSKDGKWTDTQALFEFGFNNFKRIILTDEELSPYTTLVKNKEIKLYYEAPLYATVEKNIDISLLTSELIIPDDIEAVYYGNLVGEEIFYYNEQILGKVNLISKETVVNEEGLMILQHQSLNALFNILLYIILIILIFILIYVICIKIKTQRK